jgi:hypothetical protein
MNKECFGIDLRDYRFAGGLTLMFFLDFYEKAGRKEAFSPARNGSICWQATENCAGKSFSG